MKINNLIKEAHEMAIIKGWHSKNNSFGDEIALIHSELSEALEEYRNGHEITEIYTDEGVLDNCIKKPEGVPVELADVIIRICDICGKYGIDLEAALKLKLEYNKFRPYRHGGKVL